MTEDLARLEEFTKAYPRVFLDDGGLPWGCFRYAGWWQLLTLLCERLEDLLAGDPDAVMRVQELGENRGKLYFRFSLTGASVSTHNAIVDAVTVAQIASYHLCPHCGACSPPSLTLEKLIVKDAACAQCNGIST